MSTKEQERILAIMEEMASAPREEMGKRLPGEKNAMERFNERLASRVAPTPNKLTSDA